MLIAGRWQILGFSLVLTANFLLVAQAIRVGGSSTPSFWQGLVLTVVTLICLLTVQRVTQFGCSRWLFGSIHRTGYGLRWKPPQMIAIWDGRRPSLKVVASQERFESILAGLALDGEGPQRD